MFSPLKREKKRHRDSLHFILLLSLWNHIRYLALICACVRVCACQSYSIWQIPCTSIQIIPAFFTSHLSLSLFIINQAKTLRSCKNHFCWHSPSDSTAESFESHETVHVDETDNVACAMRLPTYKESSFELQYSSLNPTEEQRWITITPQMLNLIIYSKFWSSEILAWGKDSR